MNLSDVLSDPINFITEFFGIVPAKYQEEWVREYEKNKVDYNVEEVIKSVMEIDNEFVKEIVYGTLTYKEELKNIANKYLSGWTINRLGNTDQAILLMGIYELMYTKTPPVVVINESVNLAKDYSDDKVKNMINATLDKVYHAGLKDGK